MRGAVEPIATQGGWARPRACVAALGLGFFDGYVWGGAASLGTPTPAVVATGVFEPGLLTGGAKSRRGGLATTCSPLEPTVPRKRSALRVGGRGDAGRPAP
jgi:hypothetical protein